jgi:hypothetical protein
VTPTVRSLLRSPAWLLEAFVATNLLFLVADIALAHSVNEFAHPAEWIPLWFSGLAGLALGATLLVEDPRRGAAGRLREGLGWLAVVVGVAGLLWHLSGEFFNELALASLVYSAPFVAPLAYTGLGLLLLLNRRLDAGTDFAWGQWVLFLAFAGVVGNYGLSLADHARNGFFDWREWIAVGTGAFGVGGVLVAILWPRSAPARRIAWVALAAQVVVGFVGFALHLAPLLDHPSLEGLAGRVIYGPPIFAPLLFVNLTLPAALGLWVMGGWRAHASS